MPPKKTAALLLLLAGAAVAALVGPGLLAPSEAADGAPSIVYISVTGEGPTAKGWFAGAPPAGVQIQEALDTFAEKGYRVVSVSPSQRPVVTILSEQGTTLDTTDAEHYYVILLER